jgi:hypothetical protein
MQLRRHLGNQFNPQKNGQNKHKNQKTDRHRSSPFKTSPMQSKKMLLAEYGFAA